MSPHADDTSVGGESQGRSETTNPLSQNTIHINGDSLTNGHTEPTNRSHLRRSCDDEPYDLICAGFGPAGLAIAIALHDALDARKPLPGLSNIHRTAPKVLFIERQSQFGWHEGMLLPGAKMQISFIKDLATMRDPRSEFTFLNYLHTKGRLAQFTNMDTFLPQRVEYADYMKTCAAYFDEVVEYGQEVVSVHPETSQRLSKSSPVSRFCVEIRNFSSGNRKTLSARNVIIAVGGKPQIPAPFPQDSPRVLHSAKYRTSIGKVLKDTSASYNIAVVGSGQSAAEVFNDLHHRYPHARTRLLIKHAALKPSDDSPFVNELFDSDQVDTFYAAPFSQRQDAISSNRNTNYGVVRGGLLQQLYDDLYMQRISHPNEAAWQHRILKHRAVISASTASNTVHLRVADVQGEREPEEMDFDAVIVASGYSRDTHEGILEGVRGLTEKDDGARFEVGRDYSVVFGQGRVEKGSGVWLQGCNEGSHGLADTLLSILAIRGGEMVRSVFGDEVFV